VKQLETLGDGTPFEYEWTGNNRIKIRYGQNRTKHFDGELYDELIQVFKGKTIRISNHPDDENLHDWIYRKGVKTRIAQYIASILCWEKYAKRGTQRGRITFF
jgi:hypothetical protein